MDFSQSEDREVSLNKYYLGNDEYIGITGILLSSSRGRERKDENEIPCSLLFLSAFQPKQ